MEQRKVKNKSWFIIIGSFIMLIGVGLISYDYLSNKKIEKQEKHALDNFYSKFEEESIKKEIINEEIINEEPIEEEIVEDINYIAVLKIPKIGLERGLVDPNSYLNNIDYNLEWLDGSSMPDQENGNVIIAGHSGNARISYFRNLDKLTIGDEIILLYNSQTYKYQVTNIYEEIKDGDIEIKKDKEETTITLITCKYNTNYQIVVIGKLL